MRKKATEVPSDDTKLQLFIRGLPLGLKKKLYELAAKRGLTVTPYCKAVLIKHVLRNGK